MESETTTLLEALKVQFPDSSNAALRSWIKNKRITVNATPITIPSTKVLGSDIIERLSKQEKIEQGITILYKDRDLVVIYKPAGLLSVATEKESSRTAFKILKNHFRPRQVSVVHRLDKSTSGLMIFSLSEEGYIGLKEQLKNHEIDRRYVGIIEGKLEFSKGIWTSYLSEDPLYKVHSSDDPTKGTLAVTHYKQLATDKGFSWLELKLETGRKNQIRVHCEAAGHSIAGDKKYGAKVKSIKRLCLHAHRLTFIHPVTKKEMEFTSPVPNSFRKIVDPLK